MTPVDNISGLNTPCICIIPPNSIGIILAILTPLELHQRLGVERSSVMSYLSWLNAVTGNNSAKVGLEYRLPNQEVSEQLDFIKVRLQLLRNLGTNSQKKNNKKKTKSRFQ